MALCRANRAIRNGSAPCARSPRSQKPVGHRLDPGESAGTGRWQLFLRPRTAPRRAARTPASACLTSSHAFNTLMFRATIDSSPRLRDRARGCYSCPGDRATVALAVCPRRVELGLGPAEPRRASGGAWGGGDRLSWQIGTSGLRSIGRGRCGAWEGELAALADATTWFGQSGNG